MRPVRSEGRLGRREAIHDRARPIVTVERAELAGTRARQHRVPGAVGGPQRAEVALSREREQAPGTPTRDVDVERRPAAEDLPVARPEEPVPPDRPDTGCVEVDVPLA